MNVDGWTNLVAATAAVVGVVTPLLLRAFEKRSRLARATRLIRLHQAQLGLKSVLEDLETRPSSKLAVDAAQLLEEVDSEIDGKDESFDFRIFIGLALIEAFLFIGAGFLEFSDFLRQVLKGESYESKLFFLEGIWGTAGARSFLLMLVVSAAMALTLRSSDRLLKRLGNPTSTFSKNVILIFLFNIALVAVGLLTSAALMVSDPLISFW